MGVWARSRSNYKLATRMSCMTKTPNSGTSSLSSDDALQAEFFPELRNFCDEEDVDDLQDSCGVDNEKSNEPPLFVPLRGIPERESFPEKAPHQKENE